jgi:imidazole glycerol-phosphate synthase subunit HisH
MNLKVGVIPHVGRNLPAVQRSIEIHGHDSELVQSAVDLESVDCLVLPGVGTFDTAMGRLASAGLIDPIRQFCKTRPLLGICVGLQILMESSEEGKAEGLGIIPGTCVEIPNPAKDRIPNINWLDVARTPTSADWLAAFLNPRFYFVHSFVVQPTERQKVALSASFGGGVFTAAVESWPVRGCQFHPEKSHRYGIEFFRDFFDKVVTN